MASANLRRLAERLDVKLAVDVSRSATDYRHITGPAVGYLLPGENPDLVSTLATPAPLPQTYSRFARATADTVYDLTERTRERRSTASSAQPRATVQ